MLSRERVRQIETQATRKLRRWGAARRDEHPRWSVSREGRAERVERRLRRAG